MIKQVIAVRKDLDMNNGRMAAQVAHAAMKVFLDRAAAIIPLNLESDEWWISIKNVTGPMAKWCKDNFTKVVVGINAEDDIYKLKEKADNADIPNAIMVDNGFPECYHGKTATCIAIGPDISEKIDAITGNLELIQ